MRVEGGKRLCRVKHRSKRRRTKRERKKRKKEREKRDICMYESKGEGKKEQDRRISLQEPISNSARG